MASVNGEIEREAVVAAVARLWQEHLDAEFPAGLRGAELEGIDMVMLDADIAGCVTTWRNNDGSLGRESLRILRHCITELDKVLPLLMEAEEFRYYERLHQLATLTSKTDP
ncbi:hypothetical protein ACFYWN_44955 [Streptomyces sp. NPDC002917]|uniref:hypothetical protein n=1 Tax=unclassified Streptomyces TaxID=2593676 RepID=UPI002E81B788|nr:hypothetical protein [Streptomyces sp. NBC_00562]WUC24285.1 hypothetical protein OHA33_38825 [Streptomyces sp. NBC_00562]